jgi:hypothetical protein
MLETGGVRREFGPRSDGAGLERTAERTHRAHTAQSVLRQRLPAVGTGFKLRHNGSGDSVSRLTILQRQIEQEGART